MMVEKAQLRALWALIGNDLRRTGMRYLMTASVVAILMIIMFEVGKMKGHQTGWQEALTTNPVNEELEYVCASLWLGEQNKKFFKDQSKR